MKRVVAIKVLAAEVAQSEAWVQRFQREVEAVARLQHPHIVMAFDADVADAGHFLVMEFVNGRDLASDVQQRGPMSVREAVDAVTQAAQAMDYAHGQGIIHRDIKPANLLRDVTGAVKVADLGLARITEVNQAGAKSGLTQAGTIMGTVDYMPPEQAMGLTTIDHRADIYSLGCTLYFLLTGEPPYEGPSLMAIMLKHREAPLPSLCAARPEVPSALDQVFQRMVAKAPTDRFATMAEVVTALSAVAATLGQVPVAPRQPAALPAPETEPSPANQTVEMRTASDTDRGRGSILLAEPSRSQALIIRGYLQKLGFQDVPTAASGRQALEIARGAPPTVVISAGHLIDMTGGQLVQAMTAEPALAAVRFVLISSQTDAAELAAPGVVRLHKPFTLEQLNAALGTPAQAPPRRLRVLVVDDSAAARAHVRTVLTGLGVDQITEAHDGAEAIGLLESQPIDLVVSDYNMPRLDGRALVDYIRHRSSTPALPVILVTTETDPGKLAAVRQLGVSAVCDKSFQPDVVRTVLASLR
jgi:CheY-like chemotaxis protein